jgi:transcriptional regulator with XRE-family HTH domain
MGYHCSVPENNDQTRHPYIGANIRYYRAQRGWSLRQLAEISGVPYTTISSWEKQRVEIPYEGAVTLARAFGVPVQLIWDHIPADPNYHSATR